MNEIIFYILSTALIIIILELPTKYKGGDHMQANDITQEVELHHFTTGTWYSNLTESILVTVAESGDKSEYFITEGEHTGKHILKSDCRQAIAIEGMRLAG